MLLFISFLGTLSVKCQTINIELKHFPAKDYMYLIMHGDKFDTVARGKMDQAGKTILVFKNKFKNYKGMSRFILNDGSGFDLVVNKETFTVFCNDEVLNADNIKFMKSPENEYLKSQSILKQKLLQKAQLAVDVFALYNETDAVYAPFIKEQEQLDEQYKKLRTANEKNPLYAARMMEIFDFLIGNSNDLQDNRDKKIAQANSFVLTRLNMDDLYTSNYWNDVLNSWLMMQLNQNKDDGTLLVALQQIGIKISDKTQFTAFAELAVRQLAKTGRDNVIDSFGSYVSQSGKIAMPSHNLLTVIGGPQAGMQAPDLLWKSEKYTFDKKQKTVLIFYEAGCNNCDNEINLLIGNYLELQKKGYEVISAASDIDSLESKKYSGRFPWNKKFCDYKGPAGSNFINYGVIGTPTIFVIDEKGIITGRYARIADTHILN
ncbi:peroxiredoxin family protein [Flavobacterium frigidimaris]|nr:redoxin domain-containing protein [Flavobacterium frigidimaris]